MNTQSKAISGSSIKPHALSPAAISATRRMYWSVRRELWENRSLYLAPLAVAALILMASLIGMIHLPAKLSDPSLNPMQRQQLIEQPFTFAALLLMFTTFIVGVFYCVDALHGERRDRSILFWKSLPVSDLTTVLSKAIIPFVVLPVVTFVVTVITQGMMLLLGSARLVGSGQFASLGTRVPLFQMSGMLLYHLVAVHSLWWAPLWGWLLVVSAWARRATFLWATLPLLAIGYLEKITFNTSHFSSLLMHRFLGSPKDVASNGSDMSMASITPSPGHFLNGSDLWIGLAFAGTCLALAVWLRRNREPI
jgi:ABC-2 type transport system permease protein